MGRIVDFAQLRIYEEAGLKEQVVNGRVCLTRIDLDYDYVDLESGMTNRERMAEGLSPYDAKTGEKIELHHMGQSFDAPFAELLSNSEHGDGKHKILHTKTSNSWRNDLALEAQYNRQKKEHWIARSKE